MSVGTLYFSERDGLENALKDSENKVFTTKTEADERDKMLEYSDEMRVFLQRHVSDLDEKVAEDCALVLAQHRELVKKAVKSPSVLNEVSVVGEES